MKLYIYICEVEVKRTMEKEGIKIYKNRNYEGCTPYITVVTPVYNRKKTIKRTIDSVENQTYRNFEYIIVDDGSTDESDDIIFEYMNQTECPVMYIKKPNGGVHTARNLGIRYARGMFEINVDSDDELLPKALQVFYDAWQSIPDAEKSRYRVVVGQCMDENGSRVGLPFPTNINQVTWPEAQKMCNAVHGEHIGFNVTKVLKDNPWPEPEGITFVTESILWRKLDQEYKAWFINDMVRIYHTEGKDHLSGRHNKTLQSCRNVLWNTAYTLNHWPIYRTTFSKYIYSALRHCIMCHVLKWHKDNYNNKYKLQGVKNHLLKIVLWIPSAIGAIVYVKKRM